MTKLQGLKAPVSKWIADYITTGCKRYDTVVERKMKIFYFDLVVYRYLKNYWCMGVPERCTGDVERESKKNMYGCQFVAVTAQKVQVTLRSGGYLYLEVTN